MPTPLSTLLDGPASFSAAERHAALVILMALCETIREAGSCPSGVLYASLLGRISLPSYEAAIGALKGAGLVAESASHILSWIGPEVRS